MHHSDYYLAVAGLFKNEVHILDEWVRHYQNRGVEHMWLLNDGSTDDFLVILQPFIDMGFVELINVEGVPNTRGRQTTIYEKYLRSCLPKTKWLLIADLDEFWYRLEELDLRPPLKEYEEYGQILVNWYHFGSSGHIEQPKSAVQGFLYRAATGTHRIAPTGFAKYWWVEATATKSILNTACLIEFGVHEHHVSKPNINVGWKNQPLAPVYLLNHYQIQSYDFFHRVKCTRGDVNSWTTHRNLRYFKIWDINDILDDRLARQSNGGTQ